MPWLTNLQDADRTLRRVWSCSPEPRSVMVYLESFSKAEMRLRVWSWTQEIPPRNGRRPSLSEFGPENHFEMTGPFGAAGLRQAVRKYLALRDEEATPSNLIVTVRRAGMLVLEWRPNPHGRQEERA